MSIGTTRNITQQFLRYRNDAKRARIGDVVEDRATAKLLGAALGADDGAGGGGGDVELGSVAAGGAAASLGAAGAPRWVAEAERIKGDMAVLRDRIGRLREQHAKALLVTFDDDAGGAAGGKVDALTREAQLSFRRLDADIRALGATRLGGAAGASDGGVREQVQRQLARALLKLSVEFRREETRFLNKMEQQRGYETGSTLLGVVDGDGDGDNDLLGGGGGGFTKAQAMRAAQSEALVDERDTEIRRVVGTIVELAQIMRDLSTLVVEQGTMLDRVDQNIAETAVRVEHGVRELVRAERHQRGSRMMGCVMVLCALIVFFLVIAVVRHV